VDIT